MVQSIIVLCFVGSDRGFCFVFVLDGVDKQYCYYSLFVHCYIAFVYKKQLSISLFVGPTGGSLIKL